MKFPTKYQYPIQLQAIAKILGCTPAHVCNVHCGRQASQDLKRRYKMLVDVVNGALPKSTFHIAQILGIHQRTVQKIIANKDGYTGSSRLAENVHLLLKHLECNPSDLFSNEPTSELLQQIENQQIENQQIENQQIENQQIENQQIENQQIENQQINKKTFYHRSCYLLFDGDKMLKAFWAENPRLVKVENL